jgi:phytanoyl-CoA hydroxylase
MREYFGEQPVLSRAHHNCMMTKHPAYGSLTGWHRDFRYWSFERADMVSVWLALGTETNENGALARAGFAHGRIRAGSIRRREVLPQRPARQPRDDRRGDLSAAADRRRRVLSLQHAAFGRPEPLRRREVLAGLHLSRISNRPLPGTRSAAKPEVQF